MTPLEKQHFYTPVVSERDSQNAAKTYTCQVNPADREDRLLRLGNGIRDEVVFPRLRAMGVADTEIHTTAMRLVREVQAGRDHDGAIAALLSVVRSGINGTVADSEVV